jgi:phospholipase D1/2
VTYNESIQKIQEFLPFSKDFWWETDSQLELLKIFIHSYHRKLTLRATTKQEFFIFIYTLNKHLLQYKKGQMEYRLNSFAPLRSNNYFEFYIDGCSYFEALAHAIESAQESVFICGWWVSPEFLLVRSHNKKTLDYRLDKLLARTAKRGVKIYVVVYYESSFISNDSAHTLEALEALHSNIRVLRHPQIILPTYWSHHEKLVVIDQAQGFVGGLDICFGRYDTPSHHVHDNNKFMYPGIEYNNCRIAEFTEVRQYWCEGVKRSSPRLPWHDVSLMVKGACVKDLSRHFIEYWNYASHQTNYADRYVLVSNSSKELIDHHKHGLFNSLVQLASNIFKEKDGLPLTQKSTSKSVKPITTVNTPHEREQSYK